MRLSYLAAAMVIGAAQFASAAVTNGDFETGNMSGWSHIGATHADTAAVGVVPPQGTYQGYVDNTGNFAGTVPDVVTLLGVPGSSILAIGQGSPTTGSAIAQDVVVTAGDVLSFDWNFMTDEWDEDPAYNDFAIFSVGTTPVFLASRYSTHATLNLVSPPAGFDGQSNYASQTYTFPTTGTVRIGFAVFNVGDAGHNSVLLLDSVSVVPEPASLGLLVLGAGMLLRRRR